MKKLESLGRSLTKVEQKQTSGGNGGSVWTCIGVRDYQDGQRCDYQVVQDMQSSLVIDYPCHPGCPAEGTVCYIPGSEA